MNKTKYVYGVKYKTKIGIGLLPLLLLFFGTGLLREYKPQEAAADSSVFNGSGFVYDWENVNVGAGGFVTGLDFADDGGLVVRTDVYGGYRWNGTSMEQLLTTETMPAMDITLEAENGFYEIAIAPSDSSRIYFYWHEYVYVSSDGGDSFERTSMNFSMSDGANNNYRTYNNRIAVDPVNPDVIYVGTPLDGFHISYNGGDTYTTIASLPDANDDYGFTGIAFDRNSGTTLGRTNRAFVSSPDNGIYVTNNSGATWSLIAGSPLNSRDIEVQSNGDLYAIDTPNNRVMEYSGGVWTNINVDYPNSSGYGAESLALDPTDDDRLFVITGGGNLTITTNGGTSWVSGNPATTATDVPWLGWVDESYFTSAEIALNPANTSELWVAQGIGVWKLDVSSNPSVTHNWVSQSEGIEELVGTDVLSIPGSNRLIMSAMDRPIFTSTDISDYPTTVAPDDQFSNGWDLAYSPTNTNFVVGLVSDYFAGRGPLNVSYSNDAGATWSSFPTQPGPSGGAVDQDFAIGGSIAASGTDNVVIVPSVNYYTSYEAENPPYYTTDGGATWLPASGLPSALHNNWYLERQILVADPVTEGTFYIYYFEHLYDGGGGYLGIGEEIYRSTDGGANWSTMGGRPGFFFGQYNAKLRAVPDNAGHMFVTQGELSGSPSAPLRRTTDGGATWTTVAGLTEVIDIGFGAVASGETYPSIYAVGYSGTDYGIWRSYDNAATWTQVGDYPRNWFDRVHTISGDANNPECMYVSFSGSGWARGCERDAGGNTAPVMTSNGGGATASISVQENQSAVTTVTATDADVADTLTYSISGGADQARFSITNGVLTFSSSPDFESPNDLGDTAGNNTYVVTVQVTDDATPTPATDTQTLTVTVTNDTGDDASPDITPPVITRLGSSPINHEYGSSYTDAGATATDNVDGSLTSSIVVGGTTINSMTAVGSYSITYNVQDAAGNDATQVSRSVNVVDTTVPVISNGASSIHNYVVGDPYDQSIIADAITANDNRDGVITGSVVLGGDTVPIDGSDILTTPGSYTLRFNVADAAGNDAVEVTVTVAVSSLSNNLPTSINLVTDSIVETVSTNQTVTVLSTTDADSGDTHSYSLVSGAGDSDNSFFAVSGSDLDMIIAPDFENPDDADEDNIYDIRLQTDDGNGGVIQSTFQITVTNNPADDVVIDDTDGVDDTIEDDSPNNGDFNGDSVIDSQQSNIASLPNALLSGTDTNNPSHYVGLSTESGTTISSFTVATNPASDGAYTYPLGMFSFTATASSVGATDTFILLLDRKYEQSELDKWEWRKYDGTTYSTIPASANLTYGTTTVGSFEITTVSYEITDGGDLDMDGDADGSITDPIGPRVLADTDGPGNGAINLARTGIPALIISLTGGGIILVTVLLRGRSKSKYRITK